ncbi:hypothetical protein BXY66_0573 [Shimia isoporae]|uniref:Lipoprotein n=1 Tax=Shimia isoporae TaxID=647720 RepID=A0A4R1NJS1_9RHOB|nr:hypothetical protein BXY66_0573 [Shimia isoporae]
MHTKILLLSSLALTFALAACGGTKDLPVRSTPQAEHPVTGEIDGVGA